MTATAPKLHIARTCVSAAENGAQSTRRVIGRPFVKGQTGNPGGRPKAEVDVVAIARRNGPEAIQMLAEIMRNPKASEVSARVSAANSLLDREQLRQAPCRRLMAI